MIFCEKPPEMILCEKLREIRHCEELQTMILWEVLQKEAEIERAIGHFMRLCEKPREMRLREQLQEIRHCEELQTMILWEVLQKEAENEGAIRHFMRFCEKPREIRHCEELQLIRHREELQKMILCEKLREEAEIGRAIGHFMRLCEKPREMRLREQLQEMRLREQLQEIRHCEELQTIRHREELQKEAEIERTIGHFLTKRNERMMQPGAILNPDKSEVKMIFGKQEDHISNRRSCHGTKLLKSSFSLAPFFFPCAGGTGHGSGQPEYQGHSDIYPSTLNVVSNCPSLGEYMQRSLAKCADVCGSNMQDGNCAYHCMRDSSKTKLVEFCAKPKPLFDYCPEYDPVDQTIQKDMATLCNSTSSRNYYNSSDIYFCDPNNCLQLHESSVRNGATTLTTLMNETTEINDGDSQEWILPLFIVFAALIAVIIIGYIVFRVFVKRGIFSAYIRKMRKKRNQNEKQNVYIEETITFG